MKFKLLESVFTSYNGELYFAEAGDTYFIYKNPTGQEIDSREDSKGNRAVLDSQGNLYMEAKWLGSGDSVDNPHSQMIHDDLLRILHNHKRLVKLLKTGWDYNPKFLKYGVLLQRGGNTKDFYLAESYDESLVNSSIEAIGKLFKKGREKNPFIHFHLEKVSW